MCLSGIRMLTVLICLLQRLCLNSFKHVGAEQGGVERPTKRTARGQHDFHSAVKD